MEMEVSNTALMVHRLVLFVLFLFSQISSKPDDSRGMDTRRNDSSVVSSSSCHSERQDVCNFLTLLSCTNREEKKSTLTHSHLFVIFPDRKYLIQLPII